jgi:hypothetical protein
MRGCLGERQGRHAPEGGGTVPCCRLKEDARGPAAGRGRMRGALLPAEGGDATSICGREEAQLWEERASGGCGSELRIQI